MNKIIPLIFPLFFILGTVKGQDTVFARKIIDTLSSSSMHGRGYVFQGVNIAADFLEKEFEKIGLMKLNNSFTQSLNFSINTFPGKAKLVVDKKILILGKEWIVEPTSTSVSGIFRTVYISDVMHLNENAFYKMKTAGKFVVLKAEDWKNIHKTSKVLLAKLAQSKGIIVIGKKPVAALSQETGHLPIILVDSASFPGDIKKIQIEIENVFVKEFPTKNIVGYIEGKQYPDSFFVISAHYDHIGRIGNETFFPGANDNASGVAMMLDLARHYALPENRPDISLVFVGFTGEEVGLLGSFHLVKNPLFPLKKIGFVLNLDLMGNGDDGITVVNGTKFEKEFHLIDSLNKSENLIKTVNKRGEAANSDHYPFYKAGVPSVFIYSNGGSSEYHNPYDISQKLHLKYYPSMFLLIREFSKNLTSVKTH